KSFPLGHHAQLISWIPGWIASTLQDTELDQPAGPSYSFEPTDALVAQLDDNARAARDALEAVTGDALAVEWTLRGGDYVMYSAPRDTAVRMHLNHLIHHRGQLTVYLRLLDVPLPSIYGPTADER
ncbi:MAG: DinB family protein, partial [Gemmatimonadota bacterium]